MNIFGSVHEIWCLVRMQVCFKGCLLEEDVQVWWGRDKCASLVVTGLVETRCR